MPYIAIKAYPKDKEIKKRVAERINQVFLEEWGFLRGLLFLRTSWKRKRTKTQKEKRLQIQPLFCFVCYSLMIVTSVLTVSSGSS